MFSAVADKENGIGKACLDQSSVAFAVLLLASPARPQAVYDMGVLTNTMTITGAQTSSVINNLTLGEVARADGRQPRRRSSHAAPSAQAPAIRLPYRSTAVTQTEAMNAYLARLQRRDPKTAASIAPELRNRNVFAEFAAVAIRSGMSPNDAGDVVAGFLVGGWEMITGRDADPAGIRGVRRQVATQLAAMSDMRDPLVRTRVAEELNITTVVLGAGATSALRDGDVDRYRRGVSSFYHQQTGLDLGSMRLTAAGFTQ